MIYLSSILLLHTPAAVHRLFYIGSTPVIDTSAAAGFCSKAYTGVYLGTARTAGWDISILTKNYTAHVSSSGDIKSFELLSENTDVSASSSGSAQVHASVSLTAKANSSGSIDYRGAANVKKTVNSSGSVEKKDWW